MEMKTNRKNIKKANAKKLIRFAIIMVACIYVAGVLVKQKIDLSGCNKLAGDYQSKISEAKAENQRLEDELKKAGTDEYLERVARDKLGLVKANERVFIDITQ